MEWLRIGFEIAFKIGERIADALSRGDDAVLDQRVGDLLGTELRTSIAKRAAEQRAQDHYARMARREDEPTGRLGPSR